MEQNNLNNNIIQNQMNNPMYNGMFFNGMMPNQMNNLIFNGMIQNQMNNPWFNAMMPNQMNYQMFNGFMQNPMNNFTNNTIFRNPINNTNNNININNIDYTENIPIDNAIKLEIDNNDQIQYYLYPEISFTEEEINKAKVLLVIGQTGHGKTTFVNALVNIYLGININDKFRYLLVKNENKNQLKSITKQITIYKIRPKKDLNFPPLIIIDTPGFGDTAGDEEDKKNLVKFKEFFDSKKIKTINCILYIIIGANSRFGENDKNIINYLLNLFSKNVKENFVVGVTNFIPESKKDIPNIIKSLSDENHFYYQNVLKNEILSREQILKSYWYFTSDNKIISNNEIERNEREKEKWKYTEEQIKFFIENKIKILEKKSIEDSELVLNNRFQLENEIKSFSEKIDGLIHKKLAIESNITEQNNYRELITKIRDKINKNDIDQKNIIQVLKEINNTLPFMKKIINEPVKTENENLICEKCQSNCHKNCNCNLTKLSKWFCNNISFGGTCKICNHGISQHKKGKFIYRQKEENELLVNNEIEEIEKYIKFLSKEKEEKNLQMLAINLDNNLLQRALNNFNKQIQNCDEEIEKANNENILIEKDIIDALKNIKSNLDFLRNNALNKENRTIKIFIEEYSKNKNDKEKNIIWNLFKNCQFLEINN